MNDIPSAYLVDTFGLNGFIALQVHCITKPEMAWRKIHWKNIRIKTSGLKPLPFPKEIYVENTIPNNLSASEKSTGWKLLFDGKTSNRWKGAYKSRFPEKGWEIKDGLLCFIIRREGINEWG